MARRAVDDRTIRHIFAIMNHDRPNINEREQCNVRELLQREDERKHVVRYALRITIERVKGMARVGCRHDPLMVRLVQVLIDPRMMQTAVDPVDAEVGEAEEKRELENVVPHARTVGGGIVHLAVSADFSEEEGDCEDGHDGEGLQCL